MAFSVSLFLLMISVWNGAMGDDIFNSIIHRYLDITTVPRLVPSVHSGVDRGIHQIVWRPFNFVMVYNKQNPKPNP